jgi:hypothetical protein
MSRTLNHLLSLATLLLPLAAAAQTPYASPDGRFTVQAPTGWRIQPDPANNSVDFHNGAVEVDLSVWPQDPKDPISGKQITEANDASLQHQCPTFRHLQTKSTTLVGFPATISTDNCSDPKSPAVGETTAALTPDNLLLTITVISPISRYYDVLPDIDLLRDTFRLVHHPYTPPAPEESPARADLHRACLVGAFSQEECARRDGVLIGKEHPDKPNQDNLPNTYTDAAGRYSVDYPAGWKAIAEGDNGIAGVQLRSGTYWINLMPATEGTTTKEVVLLHEQKLAGNSGRTPPFSSVGLVQLFGHGLEITFDSFSSSTREGEPIDSTIAGIGDISGHGHNFLLLVASLPKTDPNAPDAPAIPIFAIAQSIRMTPVAAASTHSQ